MSLEEENAQLRLALAEARLRLLSLRTLKEAKHQLFVDLENGERVTCPCCGGGCKYTRRSVNSAMARNLISFHKEFGREWGPLKDATLSDSRDESRFKHFGLLESARLKREDGGSKGVWRITPNGVAWLKGWIPVQHYAHVFNDRVVKFSGGDWWISDALGHPFNYNELMETS